VNIRVQKVLPTPSRLCRYITFKLKKGANLELSFPKTDNTGMLMIEGEAKVNDETAKTDHFVLFNHDGDAYK
jgi:redox-sensitive bicupin YhaK (pirin superfamily)